MGMIKDNISARVRASSNRLDWKKKGTSRKLNLRKYKTISWNCVNKEHRRQCSGVWACWFTSASKNFCLRVNVDTKSTDLYSQQHAFYIHIPFLKKDFKLKKTWWHPARSSRMLITSAHLCGSSNKMKFLQIKGK